MRARGVLDTNLAVGTQMRPLGVLTNAITVEYIYIYIYIYAIMFKVAMYIGISKTVHHGKRVMSYKYCSDVIKNAPYRFIGI